MIIDYINQHQGEFWIAFGFAILAVEVLFFGMTTIVLLFGGLGALITGLMMLAGMLPETWLVGIAGFGINSAVITAILWKPLQRLQGKRVPDQDKSSDLIGLEFVLEKDIQLHKPGKIRYSGINWRVEIDPGADIDSIAAGQRVTVTSVEVGIFRIKPILKMHNSSSLKSQVIS